MPKKIYDIKPPKVADKKIDIVKELSTKNPVKKTPARRKKPVAKHTKRNLFIVGGLVVVAIGVYLFFTLPRVTVEIWPKLDTLSFQQTVTADTSADAVDTTNAVIPAKSFEADKTESQDFPATGNADNVGQASGTITVYNKYDPPTTLTLKAGTHFMSDSGKLFVSLSKVVIPAAKKSGGTVTPGSVDVKVQAVDGGDSYNIAPSNFSVPGLKGSAYYYAIYATSSASMAGGYTGNVKEVTDDDIQTAKDTLTKKVTDDALADLKKQISSDYVLSDNAIFTDTTDASTQSAAGTVADTFTYNVTVKASALAFKKSDIDGYAKNYIISQIPDGKTLLDSSFKTDYTVKTIDVSGGQATIALSFSSQIYQDVDKNLLSLSLMDKNAAQISQTLSSILSDQVDKTDIHFWPFWVTKSPDNQKDVTVSLKFN